MFDPKTVSLGIAPIGWCNDDMPELGAENTFQQTVSEMALAGFTGCEIGNKYPTDPAELKKALDLRGMRIASRWYSSFILTRSMEEEERTSSPTWTSWRLSAQITSTSPSRATPSRARWTCPSSPAATSMS